MSKHTPEKAAERTRDTIKDASRESYEVWEIDIKTGTVVTMKVGGHTMRLHNAESNVSEYNAEEAENARMEMRPVKSEFIVIKSITAYTRVTS